MDQGCLAQDLACVGRSSNGYDCRAGSCSIVLGNGNNDIAAVNCNCAPVLAAAGGYFGVGVDGDAEGSTGPLYCILVCEYIQQVDGGSLCNTYLTNNGFAFLALGEDRDDALTSLCGAVLCNIYSNNAVSCGSNGHPLDAGRSINGNIAALEDVRDINCLCLKAQRIVGDRSNQVEVNCRLADDNLADNSILVLCAGSEGNDSDTLLAGVVLGSTNGDLCITLTLCCAQSEPVAVDGSVPTAYSDNIESEFAGGCGELLALGRYNQYCIGCGLVNNHLADFGAAISLGEDGNGCHAVCTCGILLNGNLEVAVAGALCGINLAPVSRRSNLPVTVASNAHQIVTCIFGE